ncbi:hypothetical protein DFO66_10129 [Brevibacterium sanguinis]|uniref:Uncharacterized protein n=2 Tax=Brevibacterium TaxID=1696 RepID=A0A366INX9_9MICO|nr:MULTISPECIES: hypothetical protein [Brevibacterium]RBP67809.1 hypothetical protein DFO66_10129 [Brevibacterium sanguinis]RBP74774.1 hypothetical protein DFO65_101500 [Brevibacterium celere]
MIRTDQEEALAVFDYGDEFGRDRFTEEWALDGLTLGLAIVATRPPAATATEEV